MELLLAGPVERARGEERGGERRVVCVRLYVYEYERGAA